MVSGVNSELQKVPEGYNKTEVGVIPMDWDVQRLGDICKFSTGSGLLKGEILPSGEIPAIPYTSLYTDFSEILDYEAIKWFVISAEATLLVNEPCVLIASSSNMEANTGKASALTKSVPVAVGREIIILKTKCDSAYISYLLSSKPYRKRTLSLARGTTIKHLYTATFYDYPVAVPLVNEQKIIVQALMDVDALITSLEKLIAKKCAIKTAAMQQLLTGKKRLPPFGTGKHQSGNATNGHAPANPQNNKTTTPGYKQTELGEIPVDWEVVDLADAAEFYDGIRKPVKSGDRAKMRGTFRYYGASGVVDYVNDYLFDGAYILLGEDGENILSRNLPLAFKVEGKFWVNNHAHVMQPRKEFNIDYLAAFLESLDYSLLNSGTAQPKLNKQSCLSVRVAKPPKAEQSKISDVLLSINSEIDILMRRLNKTQQIKQGMMQELLTGRTRLI